MKHILDTTKPRYVKRTWLAVSTPFALVLLSLAALRVSARPAAAQLPTDRGAATMKPVVSPSRRSISAVSADTAEKPGTTERADGPQVNGGPAATLDNVGPVVILAKVIWGKAVDGLEPGFLLTTPGFADSRRVPLNAHVDYQVLVRNVTDRERFIEVRRGGSDPWNTAPYLIPNADLRNALNSHNILERFRARGTTDLAISPAAYDVELSPGESAVVPGDPGLNIGAADQQRYPRIESIQAGMNWIVQPITIRRLTAEEAVAAERISKTPYASKQVITPVDRAGRTGQRSVSLVGAGSGGKQLFASSLSEKDPGERRGHGVALRSR